MTGNIADFNLTTTAPDAAFSGDPASGVTSSYGGSSNSLGGNLAGVGGIAALGAGIYDIAKGNPNSPAQNNLIGLGGQLQGEGQGLLQEGQGLQSYLEQGTLPPAEQAQLELAQNAAKARLIQGAGSRGQNTNPMGNSGLTQDINSLGLQTLSEKGILEKQLFDAGQGLITEGTNALGMDAGIQEKLAAIDAQQQADTTSAITNFAKSLGSMNWGQIGSTLGSLATVAAV